MLTDKVEVVNMLKKKGANEYEIWEECSEELRKNPEIIKLTCDRIDRDLKDLREGIPLSRLPLIEVKTTNELDTDANSYEEYLFYLTDMKKNNPELAEAINKGYIEKFKNWQSKGNNSDYSLEDPNKLFDEIVYTNCLTNNELANLVFNSPEMKYNLSLYLSRMNKEDVKKFAQEVLKDDNALAKEFIKDFKVNYKVSDLQELLGSPLNEDPVVVGELANSEYSIVIPDDKKKDVNYNISLVNEMGLYELAKFNPEIFENVEFFKGLLKNSNIMPPEILEASPEELRNDPDFVRSCIISYGRGLEYASDELRSNPEFVKSIIESRYGYGLEYASDELKNNPEFIIDILKINSDALLDASDELKLNRDFVIEAIKATNRKSCFKY